LSVEGRGGVREVIADFTWEGEEVGGRGPPDRTFVKIKS